MVRSNDDAVSRKHRRICRESQRRRRRNAILFTSLVRATLGTSHPIRGVVDSSTGGVEFSHRGRPRGVTNATQQCG